MKITFGFLSDVAGGEKRNRGGGGKVVGFSFTGTFELMLKVLNDIKLPQNTR